MLVKVKVDYQDDTEYFLYNEAFILTGGNNGNFFNLINEGKIILDLRMHLKNSGEARNHGNGFRIYEKYLENLYLKKQSLI